MGFEEYLISYEKPNPIVSTHQNYWDWLWPKKKKFTTATTASQYASENTKQDMLNPEITRDDIADAERQVRKIARQLITRLSRQRKTSKKRQIINFRTTIRKSITTGGVMIDVKWKKKQIRKPRIIAIIDTSGSMSYYVKIIIMLMQAINKEISNFELFIFADRLEKVTKDIKKNWKETIKVLEDKDSWGGGTNIGHSLNILLKNHKTELNPQTIVIMLSDLQTINLDYALKMMELIKRKVKKTYVFVPRSKNDYKNDLEQFDSVIDGIFITNNIEEMANAVKRVCLK